MAVRTHNSTWRVLVAGTSRGDARAVPDAVLLLSPDGVVVSLAAANYWLFAH